MEFRNLTPHAIVLFSGSQEILRLAPSGLIARISITQQRIGSIRVNNTSVPIHENRAGAIQDLPAPVPGVFFIVSSMVLDQCQDREDVLSPDTGSDHVVRDTDGRVLGVTGFIGHSKKRPY